MMMSDEIKQAIEALKPFIDFADARGRVPDSLVITSGSSMAKRQLTMGDCYRAREAAAALDRLSGRVTVKALDFDRYGEAHGLGGKYAVYEGDGGWRAVFYPTEDDPTEVITERVTEAEAFAAAQADFESRILAAIDTAPAPDAQPVAWIGQGLKPRTDAERKEMQARGDSMARAYDTPLYPRPSATAAAAIREKALREAASYHDNFLMTQTSVDVEKIVASTQAILNLITGGDHE